MGMISGPLTDTRQLMIIPYTLQAFSFARRMILPVSHSSALFLAAKSATHGIMAVWQRGNLPLMSDSDSYILPGTM